MSTHQITIFLTMADNLSFSKTAQILNITQPTVSRQISMLEEEWGVTLFERTKRHVSITEAGTLMADVCRKNQKNIDHALEKARK